MGTALEFGVFMVGLALQVLIFMDRVAVKDGSSLLQFYLWLHFCCLFTSFPSWAGNREEK